MITVCSNDPQKDLNYPYSDNDLTTWYELMKVWDNCDLDDGHVCSHFTEQSSNKKQNKGCFYVFFILIKRIYNTVNN